MKLGVSLFEKDRFLIEFWLKLERLPAKEKFLFSRAQLHGSQNGLFLTLLPDGSLCYRQVSSRVPDYHPEQPISPSLSRFVRQVSAPAGTIKPGQWHHLSVYAGGFMAFPSGDRISLWVDGKELGRLDYGWYLEKENQPTELQLGDEDFVCSLDELRIMTGVWRKYYPWPDDSFTDPERKRTLEKRIEFVAPENDICFQASFEGSLQPEKAAPGIRPLVKDQVSFAPGVRGQAVLLPGGSSVSYPVKDNLSLSQGSVEMWFKPLGWAGDHRPQQSFFTISDNRKQTRWFWYITNCGYMSPTAIFGGSSSPGSGNGYVEYPPDTWTHLLLTWNGSTCKLFVNGKLTVSSLSRHRFDEDFSPGYFTLPSGGPALVDELFIYRRDLSPAEAGNHYSRYFAHGELKRVGSGRDLGSITYSDFPGAGKIKVNLHFFRPLPENTRIEISLTTQGKEVVKQSFALSPDSQYLVSGVPYHPGKNLSLTVRCFDRTSKLLGQMSTPFHRPDFPWLGNSIGLTRKVLKPWTPMEVVGKTVRVVGRSHLLAGTGLFASLEDFGEEILAGPMRIEIVSGKTTLQAIPASKLSFTRQAAHQVRWKSSAVAVLPSGRLLFHISAEMDYDGSTKFTIEYMPEKGNLPLEGLTLIVPLKNEFVKTFSTVGSAPAVDNWKDSDGVLPDQPGVVFQSSDLFGRWKMTLGNFLPMLWIGNDERGLAYMADNDRGWFPSDRYPAITIYRHPHAAEWRFHFISEPVTLSGK
ncbi:MAG TPA: DUF6067 family protein, partial [bacterium]|nr:DUF6067 family protein [bacterium]